VCFQSIRSREVDRRALKKGGRSLEEWFMKGSSRLAAARAILVTGGGTQEMT
jgi:hypothetical protein